MASSKDGKIMQQQQQQQTTRAPLQRQKPARKVSLIVGFTVTFILLVVTGISFLRTSGTSPYTLGSAFFALMSALFSFGQLSLIVFPPQSQPTNVTYNEHHHHYPPSGNVQTA